MPIGLTTSGSVIFRESTTATLTVGGTRGGDPAVPQPAAPSPRTVVRPEQTNSSICLAASLVWVSRSGIMAVLLQELTEFEPGQGLNATRALRPSTDGQRPNRGDITSEFIPFVPGVGVDQGRTAIRSFPLETAGWYSSRSVR